MNEIWKIWDWRYKNCDTPWDKATESEELRLAVEDKLIKPCRAIDIGCGTGSNALYLARRGFNVSALEISPTALRVARKRAAEERISINFILADLTELNIKTDNFDFVLDSGCYHCARLINSKGYMEGLLQLTMKGTQFLLLAGNANSKPKIGPPKVYAREIYNEFENYFEINWIKKTYLYDQYISNGVLGWACMMTRKI